MCGVVGYVGRRDTALRLLTALEHTRWATHGLDVDQPRNLAKTVTVE